METPRPLPPVNNLFLVIYSFFFFLLLFFAYISRVRKRKEKKKSPISGLALRARTSATSKDTSTLPLFDVSDPKSDT